MLEGGDGNSVDQLVAEAHGKEAEVVVVARIDEIDREIRSLNENAPSSALSGRLLRMSSRRSTLEALSQLKRRRRQSLKLLRSPPRLHAT